MSIETFIEELKQLDDEYDSPAELIWNGGRAGKFVVVQREDGAWESRWGIGREYVLQFPPAKPQLLSRFLRVSWEDGATEVQEDHPAGTEWVEVYPQEKTITIYVTKKHDDTKVETTTIPLF